MVRSPFSPRSGRGKHPIAEGVPAGPLMESSRGASKVESVAVLGLGRFGVAMSLELMSLGIEVLGVDTDEDVVQEMGEYLTHAVQADVSRAEVLEQLGVTDFDRVVVAIGADLTANILTTSLLRKLGVPELWAMATSEAHAEILRQLGVEHVVSPQQDMGRRTAHIVGGRLQDWVDYGGGFGMAKIEAPEFMIHHNVAEARLPERFDVKVVARRSPGQPWVYITPQTEIQPGDVLIVAGGVDHLAEFAKKS
ncbi:TrkA family potassium uptake protein [Dermabacteraceae bacterium TAE3-ERU27]|nr:TrkA family potassium uptake protein [Dermabacteraceae bacterium TAE3-ERU27]